MNYTRKTDHPSSGPVLSNIETKQKKGDSKINIDQKCGYLCSDSHLDFIHTNLNGSRICYDSSYLCSYSHFSTILCF